MKATTRAIVQTEQSAIWDSPLIWSTVALCSAGTLVFFWRDFGKMVTWFVP